MSSCWRSVETRAQIAAFALIEGKALFQKKDPQATLSAHVWAWFAVKDTRRTGWVRLRRWGLLAFMVVGIAVVLAGSMRGEQPVAAPATD